MENDLFSFLKDYKDLTNHNLKDDMKTILMRAKNTCGSNSNTPDKNKYYEILAKAYIKLYKIMKGAS